MSLCKAAEYATSNDRLFEQEKVNVQPSWMQNRNEMLIRDRKI